MSKNFQVLPLQSHAGSREFEELFNQFMAKKEDAAGYGRIDCNGLIGMIIGNDVYEAFKEFIEQHGWYFHDSERGGPEGIGTIYFKCRKWTEIEEQEFQKSRQEWIANGWKPMGIPQQWE